MNYFFFTNFSKSLFLFLVIFFSYTLSALSEPGVSVFMYHRFDENKYPSTNVTEKQFLSHIDYVVRNNIKILSLMHCVAWIKCPCFNPMPLSTKTEKGGSTGNRTRDHRN